MLLNQSREEQNVALLHFPIFTLDLRLHLFTFYLFLFVCSAPVGSREARLPSSRLLAPAVCFCCPLASVNTPGILVILPGGVFSVSMRPCALACVGPHTGAFAQLVKEPRRLLQRQPNVSSHRTRPNLTAKQRSRSGLGSGLGLASALFEFSATCSRSWWFPL